MGVLLILHLIYSPGRKNRFQCLWLCVGWPSINRGWFLRRSLRFSLTSARVSQEVVLSKCGNAANSGIRFSPQHSFQVDDAIKIYARVEDQVIMRTRKFPRNEEEDEVQATLDKPNCS